MNRKQFLVTLFSPFLAAFGLNTSPNTIHNTFQPKVCFKTRYGMVVYPQRIYRGYSTYEAGIIYAPYLPLDN